MLVLDAALSRRQRILAVRRHPADLLSVD